MTTTRPSFHTTRWKKKQRGPFSNLVWRQTGRAGGGGGRGRRIAASLAQKCRGNSHCSQRLRAGWLRKVQAVQFHCVPSSSSWSAVGFTILLPGSVEEEEEEVRTSLSMKWWRHRNGLHCDGVSFQVKGLKRTQRHFLLRDVGKASSLIVLWLLQIKMKTFAWIDRDESMSSLK